MILVNVTYRVNLVILVNFVINTFVLIAPKELLGKPLHKKSAVQTEFVQIAFQPPLKQTDAFWELFSPKICQFFKTAVLTLEIDILTIIMIKFCS